MKKLMLSAVLGMFCYCTNNSMNEGEKEEKPEEEAAPIEIKSIDDVLITMLVDQNNINETKNAIKELEPRIYSTIKDEEEKVKKGKVLEFITNQFTEKEQKLDGFNDCIEVLEQYFHLEGENDEYECTKDNLTEIFGEEKEGGEAIDGVENDITNYLGQIVYSEEIIYECFTRYYYIKKAEKTKEGEVENVEDMVIEEITNECCEGDKESKIHANFLANLDKICENSEDLKKQIGDKKDDILKAIQRRITLDKEITKENLKSFIKQKIVIEEEKEEEKKDSPKGAKPAEEKKKNSQKGGNPAKEEGCCTCCNDCCGKEGKPVVLTKKLKK